MCSDPVIIRLCFSWAEVQKLYIELGAATTGFPLYGEETCDKGFWLFGGERVSLMSNAFDARAYGGEGQGNPEVVYAQDYDPTEIEDSSYWEDPLLPIVGDNSPVFIDAYELQRIAAEPPEPGMLPQFLCIDLRKDSISPAIIFTEKDTPKFDA